MAKDTLEMMGLKMCIYAIEEQGIEFEEAKAWTIAMCQGMGWKHFMKAMFTSPVRIRHRSKYQ